MVSREVVATEEKPAPDLTIAAKKLERELAGEEQAIGERRIRPMARMTGWYGSDAQARAGLAWAWVRLQPTGVQVREADGQESFVPVEDVTAAGLRQMALVGLLVAAICGAIMLLLGRRKNK